MKSNEEFKVLLFKKKAAWEKRRRKRLLTAGISLGLCGVLALSYSLGRLPVHTPEPTEVVVFGTVPVEPEPGITVELLKNVTPLPVSGTETDKAFIKNQMRFSVELLKSCYDSENMLISPLSISLALSMAANGAQGQTLAEMESLLAGDMTIGELNRYLKYYVNRLPATDGARLTLANSVWYRNNENRLKVEPKFLQTVANYYDADAFAAPFDDTTLADINRWVSDRTDGQIPEALDQISDDAVMYLINALLFDAKWQEPYTEKRNSYFQADSETLRRVEMMEGQCNLYLDDGKATGFIKDYQNGYRFVALMPNEGITLEEYISSLTWEGLLDTLRHPVKTAVDTGMPKFECSYDTELRDVLEALGMKTAFDSQAADFSAMINSSAGNISINRVIHKAHITVGEAGTKAGAATVVEMYLGGVQTPARPRVTLGRPFLYLIVDRETNLPIFIGTATDIGEEIE